MKNKRMIYIYDENMDIYDEMENRSEWINHKLRELREKEDVEDKSSEFEEKIRKLRGRPTTDSRSE